MTESADQLRLRAQDVLIDRWRREAQVAQKERTAWQVAALMLLTRSIITGTEPNTAVVVISWSVSAAIALTLVGRAWLERRRFERWKANQ